MNQLISLPKNTGVAVRRGLLAHPEALPELSIIERAIFEASTERTIGEMSGAELAREILPALRFIMRDVGYREQPGDLQYLTIRMPELLKRHYAALTLREIRLAFELSLTGELDPYLPKNGAGQPDRSHYQSFSAEYICKVLNAYKARRGWVTKKVYEAVTPKEVAKPDGESTERMRGELVATFLHYKYRGYLPALSAILLMRFRQLLAGVGLCEPEHLGGLDQQQIIEAAVLGSTGREQERRGALVGIFERMLCDEIQITDYIKL